MRRGADMRRHGGQERAARLLADRRARFSHAFADALSLQGEGRERARAEPLIGSGHTSGFEEGRLRPRRLIGGINYSKKTISVEFLLGGTQESTSQDFSRPPDGKSRLNQRPSLAAPRAAPLESLSARTSESNLLQSGQKQKGSGRNLRTDPLLQFESLNNGYIVRIIRNFICCFPNIAHHYWENFRLTGEFHVRQAKAPRF
jgi:hypothetical protein